MKIDSPEDIELQVTTTTIELLDVDCREPANGSKQRPFHKLRIRNSLEEVESVLTQ